MERNYSWTMTTRTYLLEDGHTLTAIEPRVIFAVAQTQLP